MSEEFTFYDPHTIPEHIQALPEDMTESGVQILVAAREAKVLVSQEVKIAHVYERKGWAEFNALGTPRNVSYGSDNDDVIIQITTRVSAPKHLPVLKMLENELTERRVAAEKSALEAKKAELTAQMEDVQKKLQALGVQPE